MALTPEDKKDVKTHLGKALANKVSSVTRDYRVKNPTGLAKSMREAAENMGSAKSKALQGKSQKFYRESKGLLAGGFPKEPRKDESVGSWSGQRHMKGK